MSGDDEDDKPTVVLDLNALKKEKMKKEEDLANIAQELEFNVAPEEINTEALFETPAVQEAPKKAPEAPKKAASAYPVILFDFGSDFFQKSLPYLPKGHNYQIVKTLPELNQCLKSKSFQIVVFNYDVNPKAVNQLSAQIKQKMPNTKTMIMAKAISPEKAKVHAQTPSGATGYYQLPLNAEKVEKEFQKIEATVKKAS